MATPRSLALFALLAPPVLLVAFCKADKPQTAAAADSAGFDFGSALAYSGKVYAELGALDRSKLADNDWAKDFAGVYYDGLGGTLHVAKSGAALTHDGCCFPSAVAVWDIVEASPDRLKIKLLAQHNLKLGEKGAVQTVYLVRWGSRKFWIPEQNMQGFVATYNGGGEERDRMSYFCQSLSPVENAKERRATPGRPRLPAEFARFILDRPARLKVSGAREVERSPYPVPSDTQILVTTEVELDGGENRGLTEGMILYTKYASLNASLTLTLVEETRSTATLSAYCLADGGKLPRVNLQIDLPGANPEPLATTAAPAK